MSPGTRRFGHLRRDIAVILGRAQFFTENTLYPVVLSFPQRAAIPGTLRLPIGVYVANIVGASLFALLLIESQALSGAAETVLSSTTESRARRWLRRELLERSDRRLAAGERGVAGGGERERDRAGGGDLRADADRRPRRLRPLHRLHHRRGGGDARGGILIVSLLNYGQIHAEEEVEEEPG